MPDINDSFLESFKMVQQEYVRKLPGKVGAIEKEWTEVIQGSRDHELLLDLQRKVHSLAGSGTTFGFRFVSETAHLVENLLQQLVEEGISLTEEERVHISELIHSLKEASLQAVEQ